VTNTLPNLTTTERKVLTALTDYVQANGYPPSVRELGDAVGIASTSSVAHVLRALEDKGRIRRSFGRSRAIQIIEAA
jgi:repressor LexA